LGVVPYGTAVFGIVMFPKPVVPLVPVTVKETIVEAADWFCVIVTLLIWVLVMFPLKDRATVEPLVVIAHTVVGAIDGAGVGIGVGFVAIEVEFEAGTGVSVGVGVVIGEPPIAKTSCSHVPT